MRKGILIYISGCFMLHAQTNHEWIKEAEKRIDPSALELAKELQSIVPNQQDSKVITEEEVKTLLNPEKCSDKSTCFVPEIFPTNEAPKLQVFMSFSVPTEAWIGLSEPLQKAGGTFVIQGLPDNSFKQLAQKIVELRKAGCLAPIQVDPQSFAQHQITQVPAFLIRENAAYDLVFGNISLLAALEQMRSKGETKIAQDLLQKIAGEGTL